MKHAIIIKWLTNQLLLVIFLCCMKKPNTYVFSNHSIVIRIYITNNIQVYKAFINVWINKTKYKGNVSWLNRNMSLISHNKTNFRWFHTELMKWNEQYTTRYVPFNDPLYVFVTSYEEKINLKNELFFKPKLWVVCNIMVMYYYCQRNFLERIGCKKYFDLVSFVFSERRSSKL